MIAPLLLALQAQTAEVRGRVVDAQTREPVLAATVSAGGARALTNAEGRFAIAAAPGDTLRVRRIGYRAALALAGRDSTVAMRPAALPLPAIAVREAAPAGRAVASRDAAELREAGTSSVGAAIARLPYVSARGARGELSLSMRGSRSEQVVVTLDGMALNDPATGGADVSDLPLAAVGRVTAAPGADAVGHGSGASGGVVALTSASGTLAAASAGAFGRYGAEGATSVGAAGGALRLGAAVRGARNDFPFVNRAGSTGSDSVESRANAGERHASAFASAVLPAVQLLALASESRRGLAGPMNVRVYDDDRSVSRRLLLRLAAQPGRWSASASARALSVAYRDAGAPALDADARALAADADAARAVGPLTARVGIGADHFRATGVSAQRRGRAFVAATGARALGAYALTAGVRVDALAARGSSALVQPSVTVAGERSGAVAPFVRVGSGFRAPTLYDLYLSAGQRIVPRPLDPERAVFDGETGLRLQRGRASLTGSVFLRETRDAIVWLPGTFTWSPRNVERERVRGAELRGAAAAAWWSADAWAGAYHSRFTAGEGRHPTPYVPYATGGSTLALRRAATSLTGTLRAYGRRPFAVATEARDYELPGVALVDLHVAHRFVAWRANALVTVGADNAGDVAWESVRRYPAPGRSWSVGLTVTPR